MRLLFILLSLTTISCWQDRYNCPDRHTYNFGEILLQDSAKQFILPYLKYKKVFFKDSLNNESEYGIDTSYKKIQYKYSSQYSYDCPEYANYSAVIDRYAVNFVSKDKVVLQGCYLESSIDCSKDSYTNYQNGYVAIEGSLSYFSFKSGKKLLLNTSSNPEITLTANGKTYKNVIVPSAKTYLHRQYGLLAFRDNSGTLWVFDRFE